MNRQREEVAYRDNWHLKPRTGGQATRGTNGPTLLLFNSSYFDNLEGVCDGDGALHGDRHRGEDAARVRDHRQPVQVGAQRRVHVTLKKTKKKTLVCCSQHPRIKQFISCNLRKKYLFIF